MKPFISLCMIVKNEEKVIERCLSSIVHLVDEAIVVDTGSTDRTKEIVAQYTDRIYDFMWINDFSAARNFAASKASGEWILVLDADEFVDEENFYVFLKELKEDLQTFDAYCAKILNFTGEYGEGLVQHFHDRIYRNNGEISYYRKIHEQFQHILHEPLNVKESSLLIFHSGYLSQTVTEKDKNKRNQELLDVEMDKEGINPFDYFNYGNEYASIGDYSKALECYLEAYKRKSDFKLAWVSTTVMQIIICLMNLKRYNSALHVIHDAEKIYERSPEIVFLKGEIYYLRGQFEDAIIAFKQIVQNQDHYSHIILRPDLKDQKPYLRLGDIYLYQENYSDAIFQYSSVLNGNHLNSDAIRKMIYILNKFHSVEEITNFLKSKQLVNNKNVKTYTRACFGVGNPDLALALLKTQQEEHSLLIKICTIKKLGLQQQHVDVRELSKVLHVDVLKDLLHSQWLNIIDLYLLDQASGKAYQVAKVLTHFKEMHEYVALSALLDNGSTTDRQEELENMYIFSLQTLLTYKQFALCEVLLKKLAFLNGETKAKTASLLYSHGFKVEALQLYNETDWSYLSEVDYLHIIHSLQQTSQMENANEIAQYALNFYPEDFRFYELILKNTSDPQVFHKIYQQAREVFSESPYLNQLHSAKKEDLL